MSWHGQTGGLAPMTENASDVDESSDVECPTCGRTDFKSRRGLKQHHSRTHDESLPAEKESITCANCGDVFEVYPYRSDDATYCSYKCRNVGRETPEFGGSVECECEWCGTTFSRSKSSEAHRKRNFCSQNCYGKWRSKNVVKENHPRWNGGPDFDYGEGWNETKRRKVRERDDNKCQSCGISQEQSMENRGRKLSVHHIIPARQFDDPVKRNCMDNLIALCPECHRRWEGIPLKPDIRNNG